MYSSIERKLNFYIIIDTVPGKYPRGLIPALAVAKLLAVSEHGVMTRTRAIAGARGGKLSTRSYYNVYLIILVETIGINCRKLNRIIMK